VGQSSLLLRRQNEMHCDWSKRPLTTNCQNPLLYDDTLREAVFADYGLPETSTSMATRTGCHATITATRAKVIEAQTSCLHQSNI
jgi:hypothetical protein